MADTRAYEEDINEEHPLSKGLLRGVFYNEKPSQYLSPIKESIKTIRRLATKKDADKVWLANYVMYLCDRYLQLLAKTNLEK